MSVEELIAELQKLPPGTKMMVDQCGILTDLSMGPSMREITKDQASDSRDCRGRVGERVAVVG